MFIWIIVQRLYRAAPGVAWQISQTAGIYTRAASAHAAAKRYTEESVGWKFKAQRYRRG